MIIDMLATAGAAKVPLHWTDLGLTRGINLGFFTLRYYSLAYLLGIIAAFWHVTKEIREAGAPLAQRHAEDLFFYCTMGIILGGRFGYAAFYTGGATGIPSLWAHPGEMIKLWEGGMSFHGGLIGVVLAIAWVCWRNGLNFLRVCDYIAPSVCFGLFFGRCANFINGELWGRAAGADVPWAMVFCDIKQGITNAIDDCQTSGIARHPSQLYEAGLEGIVLGAVLMLLFWKTSARWRPGLLMGTFGLGYGISRFIVEFFREPDKQLADFAAQTHMSMGQWLTVPMIAIGLFFVVRAMRRPVLGVAAA